MKLNKLPKSTTSSKKRLGRGYGSGKGGHTSSRGSKGQRARNKIKIWFEGGQLPLTKRLPFNRGKGRFRTIKNNPLIVNLKHLNLLPKNSKVTSDTLVKHKIINAKDAQKYTIKILGNSKLEKPLTVLLPTSKSAATAIKKAGGTLQISTPKSTSTSLQQQSKKSKS